MVRGPAGLGFGQPLYQDLQGLLEARVVLLGVSPPHGELLPAAGSSADADPEPPVAQVVHHGDFFQQPDRVMQGEHIDQRAEEQPLGTLRNGGQVDGLVGRQAQGRVMVLGDVVAVKTGPLCLRHPIEPVSILLVQGDIPSTLQMVEDAKLHAHGTAFLLDASGTQT